MHAAMVELADTQDLGSCEATRVGSSPTGCIFRIEEGAAASVGCGTSFFRPPEPKKRLYLRVLCEIINKDVL